MTDRNESLIALAERCEKATGPDRELDGDIADALFPPKWGDRDKHGSQWNRDFTKWNDCASSCPTASLDAAMMLLPKGFNWLVRADIGERPFANVSALDANNIIDRWDDEAQALTGSGEGHNYATAATPALALCAAALRARGASQ